MCFVKSSPKKVPEIVKQEPVKRHTADASQTKIKSNNAYEQNIRTSAIGLSDEFDTKKKTLLGE